jgi:hypothetical protein
MLHNAAVMYSGQGKPVPPPELNQEIIEAENEPPAVEAAQPTDPKQEEPVLTKARIAQEIAAPLIDSLNKQQHGQQFAAGMILTPKIMGFPGRVVYEMAIAEGQDGLLAILQSYPPLWEKLIRIPKQLHTFVEEFFDRNVTDQIVRNAQNPQQQQAPSPAPAVEVLPPEQPQGNGRVVVGPDGRPIQTAQRKGPVVNGPVVTPGPVSAA